MVLNWIDKQLMENSFFYSAEMDENFDFESTELAQKIKKEDRLLYNIRELLEQFNALRIRK